MKPRNLKDGNLQLIYIYWFEQNIFLASSKKATNAARDENIWLWCGFRTYHPHSKLLFMYVWEQIKNKTYNLLLQGRTTRVTDSPEFRTTSDNIWTLDTWRPLADMMWSRGLIPPTSIADPPCITRLTATEPSERGMTVMPIPVGKRCKCWFSFN